ncbi:hypothetical protein PTKIN_Ptkin08bG0189600 [Pterospermum kingtungense]
MDIIKLACTHQHSLTYCYGGGRRCCEVCGEETSGASYTCRSCNGWLHDSCAKELQHLPQEILFHPLHSQHQLKYLRFDLNWDFICDGCLCISAGSRYNCSLCNFNLDLTCASLADDPIPVQEWRTSLKKTIQHYSHYDKLTLFKYRKIKEDDYTCSWCEKRLSDSDVCYGCIDDGIFLHEGCIKKIPRKIKHPFHDHPLLLQYASIDECQACGELTFSSFSPCYVCQSQSCKFRLDFRCSKLFPTLKHECHPHLLTYFANITSDYQIWRFRCHVCCGLCGDNFYRCVECKYNFHLQCLSLSSSAIHKNHRHPLVLVDSFKEDDSEEYYCDICENERNRTHPVYYCEKCTFIAHVECVLHKDTSEEVAWSVPQSMDEALSEMEMEQAITDDGQYLERPLVHDHYMKFYRAVEKVRKEPYCSGCLLILRGPGYICPNCPAFLLHEKCAKLPEKRQHPFHSTHPLNLYAILPGGENYIICDECRDISLGFIYFCEECNFKLDIKCAHINVSRPKDHEKERATLLDHFTHHHQLILVNSSDRKNYIECKICELSILGPAYFCPRPNCYRFIVHESCLGLPQKIKLPFHLDHMLVLSSSPYSYIKSQCYACSLSFSRSTNHWDNVGYSCEQCDIKLHSVCAGYLRLPLKRDTHEHNLYYFGTFCQRLFARYKRESDTNFYCNKCRKNCNGKPFYRCLQCAIVFHLECVPIPRMVKSGCHLHPLVLKDSFVEDDSGEYYCDVCEEERRGNDHVYYCEECNGLFVAHIECALAKVCLHDLYIPFKFKIFKHFWL